MDDENVDVEKLLGVVPEYMKKVKCDTTRKSGPFKCAVKSCKNRFVNFELHQRSPYKFHNFPTNPEVAGEWIKRCKVPEEIDSKFLKVCSDHFDLDDYLRNYKEEIFNPKFKRELKPDAVPHKKLVSPGENVSVNDFELEQPAADESESKITVESEVEPDLKQSFSDKVSFYQKEVVSLESDIRKCKRHLATIKATVKAKKQKIKNYKKLERAEHFSKKKIFTKAQFRVLQGKKAVWSNDDFARAFSLRHIGGKQCYLYLKNTLGWPLPSLSSLQMWSGSNY